ncbi:hypothetical protein GCM10010371_68980 [Streptomyces subrutilus]|uniref:Uncharacterized protein n=1 Tax=Streptomyces subrutilus TaxID=36818 RepID=A0A918RI77_9ACTN|nr:hypothetical protein GCM10010371_68980 [Streptomyces subrutilus]
MSPPVAPLHASTRGATVWDCGLEGTETARGEPAVPDQGPGSITGKAGARLEAAWPAGRPEEAPDGSTAFPSDRDGDPGRGSRQPWRPSGPPQVASADAQFAVDDEERWGANPPRRLCPFQEAGKETGLFGGVRPPQHAEHIVRPL